MGPVVLLLETQKGRFSEKDHYYVFSYYVKYLRVLRKTNMSNSGLSRYPCCPDGMDSVRVRRSTSL